MASSFSSSSSPDVVPLVRRLVTVRFRLEANPASRRNRQSYYALLVALYLLGYDFLPELGDTWDDAICSPSVVRV